MEVGTVVSVQIIDYTSSNNTIFQSKVIDVEDEILYIDRPSNFKSFIMDADEAKVDMVITYQSRGAIYKFDTEIIKFVDKTVPAVALVLPNEENFQKIQRRQHVRINTAVDVAVHCSDDSFTPFTSVTEDISGGGALLIIPPQHEGIRPGTVSLYFVLQFIDNDYEYIKLNGEILRTYTQNEVHKGAVQFHIDDEQVRQKIIRYCFEIQRSNIQQNLI